MLVSTDQKNFARPVISSQKCIKFAKPGTFDLQVELGRFALSLSVTKGVTETTLERVVVSHIMLHYTTIVCILLWWSIGELFEKFKE